MKLKMWRVKNNKQCFQLKRKTKKADYRPKEEHMLMLFLPTWQKRGRTREQAEYFTEWIILSSHTTPAQRWQPDDPDEGSIPAGRLSLGRIFITSIPDGMFVLERWQTLRKEHLDGWRWGPEPGKCPQLILISLTHLTGVWNLTTGYRTWADCRWRPQILCVHPETTALLLHRFIKITLKKAAICK